jgi:hypothetical protein
MDDRVNNITEEKVNICQNDDILDTYVVYNDGSDMDEVNFETDEIDISHNKTTDMDEVNLETGEVDTSDNKTNDMIDINLGHVSDNESDYESDYESNNIPGTDSNYDPYYDTYNKPDTLSDIDLDSKINDMKKFTFFNKYANEIFEYTENTTILNIDCKLKNIILQPENEIRSGDFVIFLLGFIHQNSYDFTNYDHTDINTKNNKNSVYIDSIFHESNTYAHPDYIRKNLDLYYESVNALYGTEKWSSDQTPYDETMYDTLTENSNNDVKEKLIRHLWRPFDFIDYNKFDKIKRMPKGPTKAVWDSMFGHMVLYHNHIEVLLSNNKLLNYSIDIIIVCVNNNDGNYCVDDICGFTIYEKLKELYPYFDKYTCNINEKPYFISKCCMPYCNSTRNEYGRKMSKCVNGFVLLITAFYVFIKILHSNDKYDLMVDILLKSGIFVICLITLALAWKLYLLHNNINMKSVDKRTYRVITCLPSYLKDICGMFCCGVLRQPSHYDYPMNIV